MEEDLSISSPVFENGGSIPKKYTSDGENISPPLVISGLIHDAASLVLVIDDPDAATDPDGPGKTFDHWVVFNISPDTTIIQENSVPYGAVIGKNGTGENTYVGPAPPNGEHRYFFKLYVLSEPLQLDENATKSDVEKAMKGKIVSSADMIGKYQKHR